MKGIYVVSILLGIYLLLRSYVLVRKKEEDVLNFLIWLVVGGGLIIVGIFPGILDYVTRILGIQQRPNAIFAIGLLVSYLLIFRIFNTLQGIKTDISKINEEIALAKVASREILKNSESTKS